MQQRETIDYIFCESLCLSSYPEISNMPLLLSCHGGIFVYATLLVKSKITIMLFNCTCLITVLQGKEFTLNFY